MPADVKLFGLGSESGSGTELGIEVGSGSGTELGIEVG